MAKRPALFALLLGATLIAAACSFDWDALDPRPVGPETLAAGGAGGAGEGGKATGGSGGRGGGGAGGAGGQPPALIDRGLVTRYFLDEAAQGMMPTQVVDAAPDPLSLTIRYGEVSLPPMGGAGGMGGAAGTGGSGPNLSWVEEEGQRGLRFRAKNRSGDASVRIENTKLTVMDGLTEATIECVARVEGVGGINVCNRIFHYGLDSFGTLTLCAPNQSISFRLNGVEVEDWNVDYDALGRMVLHAVLDTSREAPDRVLLYINGSDQGVGEQIDAPPAALEPIVFGGGRQMIGNRPSEDASLRGAIYYCAMYSVAFTAAEVLNNADLLMANDDRP